MLEKIDIIFVYSKNLCLQFYQAEILGAILFCKQFTAEIEALEQPKLILLKYS